jgi:autotransporter-associated beta strand protein
VKILIPAVSAALLLLPATLGIAANKWWDSNGTVAGAGVTPTGTWSASSTFWNATADGTTTAPGAWVSGDSAFFSAGNDASGPFTVTLSGTQTAAALTVEEGSVSFTGSGAAALGTGSITISSGAKLSIDNSARLTGSGSVVLNGSTLENTIASVNGSFIPTTMGISLGANGGTLSFTTANILNIVQTGTPGTVISGSGGITKTGAGVLAISTASTYLGPTLINNGELRIRNTSNRLPITTAVTVTSPGILNLNGVAASPGGQQIGSLAGTGDVGLGSSLLTVGDGTSTLFSGAIKEIANAGAGGYSGTGHGSVTKVGAGTLTFGGLNSFQGTFTLSAGVVTVNSGASLCGAICDVVISGGTLNLNNTAQTVENLSGSASTINLGSGHTLTVNPVSSATYSGTIAGSGAITKTSASTEIFSGPNSYDGNTLVNVGRLQAGSATALGSATGYTDIASGAEVLFDGAATTFTCNEPFRIAGIGLDGGAITIQNSATPTLSGPISLTADAMVTVSSSATVTFNNANGFTSLANQNLTLQGGAGAGGGGTISGIIALGSGGLTKLQGGTWKLAGANTYGGATAITAGTLRLGASGVIPDGTGKGDVSVTGTLDMNTFSETINGLNGAGTVDTVAGGTPILTVGNNDATSTFTGVIKNTAGTLTLTKTGAGTLTLSGLNTYSGDTTVSAGTLKLGAAGVIPDGTGKGNVSVIGTLDLNAFSEIINGLNGSGIVDTVAGGTPTLSVGGNNANGSFSGTIQNTAGTLALGKVGNGTVTLSGSNTYSGSTTISAGTLQVSNGSGSATSTNAVTVNVGATLTGGGSIAGVVTVNGTISPGSSPGALATGSETWTGGGHYTWQVNAAGGTAGAAPGWDQINVTGGLNITATSASKFNIDIASLNLADTAGSVSDFDNTMIYTWSIAKTTAGITGFDPNAFTLNAGGFSNSLGNGVFIITTNATDLLLRFVQKPAITLDPQPATIAVSDSITLTVAATGEPTLAYQWRHDGSPIAGATATSYSINSAHGTDAGNYDVVVTNVVGTATSAVATLTVTKINQGITFNAPADQTYGASFNPGATASSGLVVSYSIVSGPATVSGNNVNVTGLGSITVRASQAGNADYNPATDVDQSFTANPASLTATADSFTRAYGTTNAVLTLSYTGFQRGETLNTSDLSGSADLTTSADTNSSPGIYVITNSVGTLTSTHYSLSFVNGSLTVTQAVLTVTADNLSRIYGASNPTLTASYSGFVNGESVTNSDVAGAPSLSLTTLVDTSSPAGVYAITNSLGSLTSTNYSFSIVDGTLTVTKAPLLVTADDQSRSYGAANPTLTASYSGFVNGENLGSSGVTGVPSVTTSAVGGSPVAGSPYAITAAIGTLASGNYSFSFADGALAVTPANLTVTADNKSRSYGAANPTLTVSYSGFANGEDLAGSGVTGSPGLTTSAVGGSPVGAYGIVNSLGTLSAPNYSFDLVNGTLTVTKAPLVVTAENKSRAYGAANPALTAGYTGFANGEDLASSGVTGSPNLTTSAAGSSPVAGTPYAITAAVGSLASGNYSFSFVNGDLTVAQAVLTVTADDKSRAYGASNPTLTASYGGFANGEDLASSGVIGSPNLTTSAVDGSPAGTYVITNALGTLSAANYSVSLVDGTLTVTKAPLIVTADNKSRAYGASNPTLTASYSGFVNGEDLASSGVTGSPGLTTSAVGNSPVIGSPYPITAVVGTLASGNYSFSFVNGALTVTPASLTVTADDQVRIYGAPNPVLTVSYAGFANGETLGTSDLAGSPSLTTSADTNSPIGSYAITNGVGTLASTNYNLTLADGILTVTNAFSATVVTASSNPVATGSSVIFTATLSALSPSPAIPAGSVQFIVDGSAFGAPVTLADGVASTSTSSLSHGTHTVTAEYAGNTNLLGSTNSLSPQLVVNLVPVPGNDSFERPDGMGANVLIATLLSNDTDGDFDTLTILSVSAASAQGGTVSTNATSVMYAPPASNPASDTFTYTVSDGFGGTATATVTVTIVPPDLGPVNITSITTLTDGNKQMNFAGTPNRPYLIQATTNLAPPIVWATISTNTAATNGLFQYIDLNATNFDSRYYRTAKP